MTGWLRLPLTPRFRRLTPRMLPELPMRTGDGVMAVKRATAEAGPVLWRIGEVAKQTGVTTRTLRYWEELGLLQRPAGPRGASGFTVRAMSAG